MQLGRSRLSPAELQHRFAAGVCDYCDHKGHSVSICPALAKVIEMVSSSNSLPRLLLLAKLSVQTVTHSLSVLMDSGAEQNFPDTSLATKLNILLEPLPNPFHVHTLSGQCLPDIAHVSEPLSLSLLGNHTEQICFSAFRAPLTPLFLGYPWLVHHNPQIDWQKGKITGGSHMHCLRSITPPVSLLNTDALPDYSDLSAVLRIYHDLREVFCKDRARTLPVHRPYDCAIDLLLRTPLPSSRLYFPFWNLGSLDFPHCIYCAPGDSVIKPVFELRILICA